MPYKNVVTWVGQSSTEYDYREYELDDEGGPVGLRPYGFESRIAHYRKSSSVTSRDA